MKKFIWIGLCVMSLLITGCTTKESGSIETVTMAQVKEKMDKKDSFAVVFTQPTCGYCEKFKEMLKGYLKENNVTMYEVSINTEGMQQADIDKMLAEINAVFPNMSGTPDLYMIKDGAIIDQFDANNTDLSDEKNFHAWVEKHQLLK